ncbi:MAG: hypothetical protein Q8922_11795 [Bacteroidota bacterium]|nr:hypothetical protein [Bacteroidota bacterium]MDP4233268.1 hypothetical protein [Bacteroidota bacterium]MDP4242112.1 hypothetical protein [Bacteroidota bacterium]MDP4288609.1 hypothetical protein [Bacteroidota bacterium]
MKTLNPCLSHLVYIKVASWSIALMLLLTGTASAQGPEGKSFGFGLIIGSPLGGTIKGWLSPENALVADIGASYFGDPRIQADYLWHFDVFHSRIVKMYAGPGLAIGFGNEITGFRWHREDVIVDNTTTVGFGMRAIFGLNVIPSRTPLEIFAEVGPLIAFSPGFGVGLDGAIGIRFYP